ncbi:MAG: hypothetical protein M3N28_05115 [Actinomycetota bacterium]|nr:hypothetical protein [Actinomycetota bacterium]
MPETATPPAPPTTVDDEVKEAQDRVDALEFEVDVTLPARVLEMKEERFDAKARGDGDAWQRLDQEMQELRRRAQEITRREQPAAVEALLQAKRRQLDELMALPTGTRDELEAALEEAYGKQQALQREQQEVEAKLERAVSGGDTKDVPKLLARQAVLPFEHVAADVRMRRVKAGFLQQMAAEAEAETPALVEAVEVAAQAVREAQERQGRAVGALARHREELREAQSSLKELRRMFAEHLHKQRAPLIHG